MMIGESLIVLFMFAYQILMNIEMSNPRAGIPAFEKENVAEISAREKKMWRRFRQKKKKMSLGLQQKKKNVWLRLQQKKKKRAGIPTKEKGLQIW